MVGVPRRVFVSHTSELGRFPAGRSFADAALDAISRAGEAPVDMKYFMSTGASPARLIASSAASANDRPAGNRPSSEV